MPRHDRPHPETTFSRSTDLRANADVHGWVPDSDVLDVLPRTDEPSDKNWADRTGNDQ